jgi:hypothetical protein
MQTPNMEPAAPQPAERRSHVKKERINPMDEDPNDCFTFQTGRFSLAEKTVLVAHGTSALSAKELVEMRFESATPWPSHKRAREAYAALFAHINDLRTARNKILPPNERLPDNEVPKIENDKNAASRLRDGVKKWTRQFLRYGTIDCEAPHQEGWKVKLNLETLTRMREILLACYIVDGNKYFYKDTEDAEERSAEFKELFLKLKISHRTLWKQLTTAFPGLHITVQPIKRVRDANETRVRAQLTPTSTLAACMLLRHNVAHSFTSPVATPPQPCSVLRVSPKVWRR